MEAWPLQLEFKLWQSDTNIIYINNCCRSNTRVPLLTAEGLATQTSGSRQSCETPSCSSCLGENQMRTLTLVTLSGFSSLSLASTKGTFSAYPKSCAASDETIASAPGIPGNAGLRGFGQEWWSPGLSDPDGCFALARCLRSLFFSHALRARRALAPTKAP